MNTPCIASLDVSCPPTGRAVWPSRVSVHPQRSLRGLAIEADVHVALEGAALSSPSVPLHINVEEGRSPFSGHGHEDRPAHVPSTGRSGCDSSTEQGIEQPARRGGKERWSIRHRGGPAYRGSRSRPQRCAADER